MGAGEEEIDMGAGLGRLGRALPLRPGAGEDQPVLGPGHRDVERAHPLRGFDRGALRLDPIEARGGSTEQAVLRAPPEDGTTPPPCGPADRPATACGAGQVRRA